MKKITTIICTALLVATASLTYAAAPLSKSQKRVVYTIKNLKLNASQQKALAPILTAYLADVKTAKEKYSKLKDKYESDIEKGTLTDNAAQALLEAKFDFDIKEAQLKKEYLKKIAATIPYKKAYNCFDLINDKMSKIEGTKSKKDKKKDDEDDE